MTNSTWRFVETYKGKDVFTSGELCKTKEKAEMRHMSFREAYPDPIAKYDGVRYEERKEVEDE